MLSLMRSKAALLPYLLIALLVGLVLLRGHQLSETRGKLKVEREFRGEIADIVKAPASDQEAVRSAARAAMTTSENRRVALETIDRDSAEAKRRSDAADAALRREQADNQRAFRAAAAKINELEQRVPSGDAIRDQEQLEEDSMAPWKGWK